MRRRGAGFTLLEVLVAMGVFTLLGFGATALLVTGLSSWRMAESRRDAAERAELVLGVLGEDLACLHTESARASERSILYADYDNEGRGRLRLARSVPPPGADPRIAGAGMTMFGREAIDGAGDLDGLKRNLLRPPGDLLSVEYRLSADEKLYRAASTPERTHRDLLAPGWAKGAQLLAEGVMHIEYNFWSPRTTAWRGGGEGTFGPSYFWDSTMGLGAEPAAPEESARRLVFRKSGSLANPRDDIFPRLVEVKFVLSVPNRSGSAYLTEDLSPSATTLSVSGAAAYPAAEGESFIKIDREWISYRGISSDGAEFRDVVRGRRGTEPAAHATGAILRYGLGHRAVLKTPPPIEPWEVRP